MMQRLEAGSHKSGEASRNMLPVHFSSIVLDVMHSILLRHTRFIGLTSCVIGGLLIRCVLPVKHMFF